MTRENVAAFCHGRIAHFKIPRHVHITDDFPMTVTGKIQKFRMRQISMQALDIGHHSGGPVTGPIVRRN